MKTLYFDCFAGASGDMIAGALIELGLDVQELEHELGKLPYSGFGISVTRVNRCGFQATSFNVELETKSGTVPADSDYEETNEITSPDIAPLPDQPVSRSLSEILESIQQSSLSDRVKSTSQAVFDRLGNAEAKVHGVPVDQVHFHEVGGLDAIVDIVSVAVGLEKLGIEAIYSSALPLGSGFIRTSHGILPVPAPATAELLSGIPVYTNQVKGELVTPTGAAILTTIANDFGYCPEMTAERIGCGAGKRDREIPNILRAFLGETKHVARYSGSRSVRDPYPEQHEVSQETRGYHDNPAVVLEANIDDGSPQLYENLVDLLLEAGALDVALIPVNMKKSRPAVMVQVLGFPDAVDDLLGVLFSESTTIGVRSYPVTKHMLQREAVTVFTEYGSLRVKIARLGEQIVNIAPEYEDCREMSRRTGLPLKEVFRLASAAYHR